MVCRSINNVQPTPRSAANTELNPREVFVRRQWRIGDDIKAIEIAAADGDTLPAADAGAHIDVHLPDGTVRQYSITTPGPAPASYLIGVLRDPNTRGGSSYLVDRLQTGDPLSITGPRNHFMLNETAASYQLIAGGIGVTPLLAMARRLVELGRPVEFHYLVRSRDRAAFLDELALLLPAGALHLHVDEEAGLPDLKAITGDAEPERHIYACGPEPLLAAIRAATTGWPGEQVQFERFKNTALPDSADQIGTTQTCRVELRQSGISFDLQADETLLEALERQQIDMPCLCREGICGTCAVGVLAGDVDHRDALQDDDEKAQNELMYVCVSRPTGPHLVLDL
jgi:ferredoxin-NADP reductase